MQVNRQQNMDTVTYAGGERERERARRIPWRIARERGRERKRERVRERNRARERERETEREIERDTGILNARRGGTVRACGVTDVGPDAQHRAGRAPPARE